MAPVAISDTTTVTETAIVSTKAQPIEKVEEVEKEVTPLEAISHGEVLPGKRFRLNFTRRGSSSPCRPARQPSKVTTWMEHHVLVQVATPKDTC